MNLKIILPFSLLLALVPLAGAQTTPTAAGGPPAFPVGPQRGTVIRPRVATNNTPLRTIPSFPLDAANPGAASPNSSQTAGTALLPNTVPFSHTQAEPADITYNFTSPIGQVLEIYAKLVGRTAFRADQGTEAVSPQLTITLKTEAPLTHDEAVLALETVLGMNGITIVPIGEKFFKVVTEAEAPKAGGEMSSGTNSDKLPDAGKFVTQIVPIKYADPEQLGKALQVFAKSQSSIIYIPSTQTLILRDYAENVKRMMEMVERIDVSSPLVIKPRVIPIKYALAADISSALSQLGASGGQSVGRSTSGANFSRPGGFGTSGPGGAGGGYGQPGGTGGFGAPSQNGLSTGAAGQRSSFQANLGRIVSSATGGGAGTFSLFSQTKIIADERTNSLLVFANDEDMKMIQDIINKLDVVLAQVLIEAIILEVNLTDGQSTGVSYLLNKQTSGNLTGAGGLNNLSSGASSFLSGGSASTNGVAGAATGSALANLPGGFSYFGTWGNDLNVVMEAIANDSRISVLSRPRIQTSHAVEADLFIGNTVPYVTGTQNYGYSSGPSESYTEKEVGITLQVTPLINPDGLVVMDINAQIEQLGPDVQIAGVGGVPTTTKRDAGAKVAVQDGQTIILGGFISASRSKSASGIPYLKDIPVLGALFRTSTIQNQRTELIILIRPTVLPNPQFAADVATTERNKMSAVKQAELEIRRDEDKRNADADAELKKQEEKDARKARKNGVTNAPVNLGDTNAVLNIQTH